MKKFAIAYTHLGKDYVVMLPAVDEEDVVARLSSILTARKSIGEVVEEFSPISRPSPDQATIYREPPFR